MPNLADPQGLRVVSFNLRYATADDGDQSWPHRKAVQFQTVRGSQAHLVGTQEGLHEQLLEIASACPGYDWIGKSRRGSQEDEFNAIFYAREAVKPLKTGDFWLSERPDEPGSSSWGSSLPRMACWTLSRWKEETFLFANCHLDHVSEEARRKGAALLLERCRDLAEGFPVVLTGDFNALPGSETYRILCGSSSYLKDALLAAERAEGPRETFHAFTGKGRGRIDWILVSRELHVGRMITVAKEEAGVYPSDHFPIQADLRFR